ncbi:MAG: sigma-70 family RNA polymerase sigma factor [Acidobacteriaceae bacterium]|nr:sigma-70 family RNA polymerase sigma factor [Acidobacteriaceae bacterium]
MRRQLEHPAALPGYVRTVLKRIAWDKKAQSERLEGEGVVFERAADRRQDPHTALETKQRVEILQSALKTLKPIEREVLRRFYLLYETKQQICEEMNLTPTRLRLLKSRSKQKLEDAAARQMRRHRSVVPQFAVAS